MYEWTWMGGNQGPLSAAVHGSRGVESAQNEPGPREGHAVVMDSAGNAWVFGGDATSTGGGLRNDLWKWNPSTGLWTWMAGSDELDADAVHGAAGESDADYMPAPRIGATLWADASDNIWLFGGSTGSRGYSDIWKFDTAANEWALMRGPVTTDMVAVHGSRGVAHADNTPGTRRSPASWSDDDGDLWLFGGIGISEDGGSSPQSGTFNDLWKYDISSNEWTWIAGSSTLNAPAVYGTQHVPAVDNVPGSRSNAGAWRDVEGNFWIFGGATSAGPMNDLWMYDVSLGQWVWVGGSKETRRPAVFGTQGVAHADNHPGGLYTPTTWSDNEGNFWLFAGYGDIRRMNTLWKYDPVSGMWTWVSGGTVGNETGVYGTQGVPDADNTPGAREYSAGWADDAGNLWVYGGGHASRSIFSDLWRYNTSTDEWTWEGGGAEVLYASHGELGVPDAEVLPGAVSNPLSWNDTEGHLWLYGGFGYLKNDSAYLSDLFKYDIMTNEWEWVQGNATENNLAVHGTMGVPSPANRPGNRTGSATWTDQNNNLWLFGGRVADALYQTSWPTDLWKFDPASGNWTWVNGNEDIPLSSTPVYGEQGVADSDNRPGGREHAATWTDAEGNLWLFGGYGIAEGASSIQWLNDLWKFDVSAGNWTWMSGHTSTNRSGFYGTRGVADEMNAPGSRERAAAWSDDEGNLWLFGGYGYPSGFAPGALNDLWKYNIASGEWTWVHGSKDGNDPGTYGTLGVSNAANTPRARTAPTAWRDNDGNLWLFGGADNPFNAGLIYNDLWKFDPDATQWTWMHGSEDANPHGTYGALGASDPANTPGGRYANATWTDPQGNFWLFSGVGYGKSGSSPQQDLWRFTTSDEEPGPGPGPDPAAAEKWELYE